MPTKRTVLDQIEILRDGTMQLRFAKEVVDDDGSVISSQPHRTALPPIGDLDVQMAATNAHLTSALRFPAVATAEVDRIRPLIPIIHTEAVKQAYRDKLAAADAATVTRVR